MPQAYPLLNKERVGEERDGVRFTRVRFFSAKT